MQLNDLLTLMGDRHRKNSRVWGRDMIEFLKRLWNDHRGNALMIAGAMLPLVVGAAGLATDTIEWTLWKRQLQRAADSAAIAGVYNRESTQGATDAVSATVTHDLSLNLHTWMGLVGGYPVVDYPADTATKTNQVHVELAVQQPLPFSAFFMTTAPTITANATAAAISAGGDACVEALETGAVTGITNTGNTAIDMPDCVMYSNSSSTNSASAGGSSAVNALAVAAVGGIQQSNNWNVGSYRPYSPPLPDPFAGVTPNPADMHCVSSALTANTDFTSLATGTNCFSSLSVGSNKSLDLTGKISGPIYINGGGADLKGAFTCTGCTIVLTNISTATNATIGSLTSNAQASNNITAPTTGPFKGIAIYQDRRAHDCSNCNLINGGSSSLVTGALYFPSQELTYKGGGTATATCTMFVARRIVFSGNSGVSNKFKKLSDCSAEGLPSTTALKMIRLVA